MSNKTWGNTMKFCPNRKIVWQLKYDYSNLDHKLIIYRDIPTYGLKREEAPGGHKEIRI